MTKREKLESSFEEEEKEEFPFEHKVNEKESIE